MLGMRDDDGYRSYGGSRYGSNNYGGYNSAYRNGETRVVRPASYGNTQSAYTPKPYAGQTTAQTARKEGGFTYGGMSRSLAPKPMAGKDLSGFRVGVTVKHPKFGKGVIVGVKGAPPNPILDIAFEGLGIKQLSASIAPLTIV